MRNVAVTDGDKVSAEMAFGFKVDYWPVGDLVAKMADFSDADVEALVAEYDKTYELVPELQAGGAKRASLLDAARQELAISYFLKEGGYKGFTHTFEDLHGLNQLPGLAPQRMMEQGFGFAGEGDWKTPALVRAMKVMGHGKSGACSFMEDYTYDVSKPGEELVLGAHMLEVCPTIAESKPRLEIHELGIGGKPDPVRMVFDSIKGQRDQRLPH